MQRNPLTNAKMSSTASDPAVLLRAVLTLQSHRVAVFHRLHTCFRSCVHRQQEQHEHPHEHEHKEGAEQQEAEEDPFAPFNEECQRSMPEFAAISASIRAAENDLLAASLSVSALVRRLQELERDKLRNTVEWYSAQIAHWKRKAQQQHSHSHGQDEQDAEDAFADAMTSFRRRHIALVDSINEVLEDITEESQAPTEDDDNANQD